MEQIKKALDKVIDAMDKHRQAYDSYQLATNEYDANYKLMREHLKVECNDQKTGDRKETYVNDGCKLTLYYRVRTVNKTYNEKETDIFDISVSSEKFEIEDLDQTPFKEKADKKAELIILFHKATLLKKSADDAKTSAYWQYHAAKTEAIGTLGIRKPIKYKDIIFQVFIAGYYGERDLQMQDAKIETIK